MAPVSITAIAPTGKLLVTPIYQIQTVPDAPRSH
jgi:hypothetical protein